MSNKEERKAPVLRFKGFTDDWEQRKLDDTITHKSGTSIEKYFSSKGLYKVISIGSYGSNGKYIDQGIRAAANEKTNSHLIKKGELSMVLNDKTGGKIIGRVLLIEKNNQYVVNQRSEIIKLSTSLWDPQFAFTYLNGPFRKKVLRIMQGGTQNYVNFSSVKKLTASLTSVKEQKEIGTLFQKLDNIIILQQRKLNELKEVKKTLLSQLFPSKGQYRPIIRFKKFTNKWTKRKLGNIAKIIGGGTPSTSNHDYWNGNINWYSPTEIGNNIFVNSSNKKISIKGLNNSSAKLLPGGKTILFTSRAGIGNMAIMLTDGCTNQGFQSWVIDDTKIDIYFLYSLGRLLKHDAIRQASGSTFLEISNKEVKKLLLEIPSFTEQKLIGNMLRKIDDDIVRQKERIILITKIKKNLLQKLFV